MPTLPEETIAELLRPYLGAGAGQIENTRPALYAQLSTYLDLLLRWNARTNLTAVRDPEEIVRRHFGEGLFLAVHLEGRLAPGATLLDFGSGAGFPGIPVQLFLPELRCCLAESQGKKAAFLREVVRTLGLTTEVWAERVESLPAERRFDCVALRAVDRMEEAILVAQERLAPGGLLAVLGGRALRMTQGPAQHVFPLPEN